MTEPTTSDPNQLPEPKQRHGCLTTYLVFMMVVNSATSILYLVGAEGIKQSVPNIPDWAFPILSIVGIFNLACAIALFRWKKWGFWGFVASSVGAFLINLSIGLGIGSAVGGLIGIAVLYGVLQIGKELKGWSQLE